MENKEGKLAADEALSELLCKTGVLSRCMQAIGRVMMTERMKE